MIERPVRWCVPTRPAIRRNGRPCSASRGRPRRSTASIKKCSEMLSYTRNLLRSSPPPRISHLARFQSQITTMSLSPCCLKVGSFAKGTPAGKIEKLGGRDCYITGNRQSKAAILLVADVFGISLGEHELAASHPPPRPECADYMRPSARRVAVLCPQLTPRSSQTSTRRAPVLPSTSPTTSTARTSSSRACSRASPSTSPLSSAR